MRAALKRAARATLERRYGADTEGDVGFAELGYEGTDRWAYEPSGWLALPYALPRREVSGGDVFADLGCGKGRVLAQAARGYPFRKVIGVELSEELAGTARRNTEELSAVEVVQADVLEWPVPADLSVVWLHNPFIGDLFSAVAEKLVREARRPLRILYLNPVEHERLLAAGARELPPPGGLRARLLRPHAGEVRRYTLGG